MKEEYVTRVKNFSSNLPDRLQTDYLRLAIKPLSVRQNKRRQSLRELPSSFNEENKTKTKRETDKLSKEQSAELHLCRPSILYYEENIPESDRPEFNNANSRTGYIRTLFNDLNENERLYYICKSVEKWEDFLKRNPSIIENQIPTLHLLLGKHDDIELYFYSLGLPTRPATNRLVFFQYERSQLGTKSLWSDLTETEKDQYGERLKEIKKEYHENLLDFVDDHLQDEYLRGEFFRNCRYAVKDYETAHREIYGTNQKPSATNKNLRRFETIKCKLLSSPLNNEQKLLISQMSDFVKNIINSKC